MKSPAVLAAEAAASRLADKYVTKDGRSKAAPSNRVEVAAAQANVFHTTREIETVARFIIERQGHAWRPDTITPHAALLAFGQIVGVPLPVLHVTVGPAIDKARADVKARRAAAKKATKK